MSTNKKLIIVTGASRGIGRSIALEFGRFYSDDVIEFILLARDSVKLNEVKKEIEETSNHKATPLVLDFGIVQETDDYVSKFKSVFDFEDLAGYSQFIVVYNHATLEHGSVIRMAQDSLIQKKFEINFFSVWSMVGAISRLVPFGKLHRQTHVNIDSAFSGRAQEDWSVQCCSKLVFCY